MTTNEVAVMVDGSELASVLPDAVRKLREGDWPSDRTEQVDAVLSELGDRADELAGELVRIAVGVTIDRIENANRQSWKYHVRPVARGLEGAKAAGRAIRTAILDSWLVKGVPIGDLKAGDLREAAEEERDRGRGHYVNAAFYEKLAAPLKNGQAVRQKWKDADAQNVLAEAERIKA